MIVAGLVLLVVVVGALTAVTVTVLPAALALGAVVLALVAGRGLRARHDPGRERTGPVDAGPGSVPRWTTRWEHGVPVEALPLVRDRLTAVLGEWGLIGEPIEPALLVVTELVSNAAEHGRGPAWLEVELRSGSVHVAVRDGDAGRPRALPRDPVRLRGRGLQLVEAVSSRWGWTDDPPGKVVWADVPTAWPL